MIDLLSNKKTIYDCRWFFIYAEKRNYFFFFATFFFATLRTVFFAFFAAGLFATGLFAVLRTGFFVAFLRAGFRATIEMRLVKYNAIIASYLRKKQYQIVI